MTTKKRAQPERRTPSGRLVVDPGWLLRAAGLVILVALLCGYATFCLLFYQGQWQLVLHPVQTKERPATIGGGPYEFVRFGPDASGVPQRTGWWMPAEAEAHYRRLVILYLPSGDGSLIDAQEALEALRSVGIRVFAMNYRGYGESAAMHPSEKAMREDAEAGWSYLVKQRHVAAGDVIPYGAGVGAALALDVATEHQGTAAVVLDGPRFDVVRKVKADARVRLLPVGALLHDRFELEPMLGETKIPKLILTRAAVENEETLRAADPKMTVVMPQFNAAQMTHALRRFLDAYAPPTAEPRLLIPTEPGPQK